MYRWFLLYAVFLFDNLYTCDGELSFFREPIISFTLILEVSFYLQIHYMWVWFFGPYPYFAHITRSMIKRFFQSEIGFSMILILLPCKWRVFRAWSKILNKKNFGCGNLYHIWRIKMNIRGCFTHLGKVNLLMVVEF